MESFEMTQIHTKGGRVTERRAVVTEARDGYRLLTVEDGVSKRLRFKVFDKAVCAGIGFCLGEDAAPEAPR